jgi:hypothetical protein
VRRIDPLVNDVVLLIFLLPELQDRTDCKQDKKQKKRFANQEICGAFANGCPTGILRSVFIDDYNV